MAILQKSKDYVFKEIKGECVMLNVMSGDYFGLNSVGTDFLALVDGKKNQDEIVAQMLEEYDITEDILKKDITQLVDKMLEKGILIKG